jgi:hypothetical protein
MPHLRCVLIVLLLLLCNRVYGILDDAELQTLLKNGDEWMVKARKLSSDLNCSRLVTRSRQACCTVH